MSEESTLKLLEIQKVLKYLQIVKTRAIQIENQNQNQTKQKPKL